MGRRKRRLGEVKMSVFALQEQLTGRLEDFAKETLLARADQTCELVHRLIEREGPLQLGAKGDIQSGDQPLGHVSREILQIAATSSDLFVALYVGGELLAGSPVEVLSDSAPEDVQTVCMVRGEDFYGPSELGGRACFVSGKPLRVGGTVRGIIIAGQFTSESNSTLLGLADIQEEIITLSEELQTDRQRSVGEFVKTIRSIAKRIHLLALNASILSAQAGEHGRGFSVVAREIGELAERTRQSTQELEQELLGKKRHVEVERRHGGRVRMLDKRPGQDSANGNENGGEAVS